MSEVNEFFLDESRVFDDIFDEGRQGVVVEIIMLLRSSFKLVAVGPNLLRRLRCPQLPPEQSSQVAFGVLTGDHTSDDLLGGPEEGLQVRLQGNDFQMQSFALPLPSQRIFLQQGPHPPQHPADSLLVFQGHC